MGGFGEGLGLGGFGEGFGFGGFGFGGFGFGEGFGGGGEGFGFGVIGSEGTDPGDTGSDGNGSAGLGFDLPFFFRLGRFFDFGLPGIFFPTGSGRGVGLLLSVTTAAGVAAGSDMKNMARAPARARIHTIHVTVNHTPIISIGN